MVLDSGTSITILRNWKVNEREIWVRVELASNKILDDLIGFLKVDKNVNFGYHINNYCFIGSTFGLILRIFIQII